VGTKDKTLATMVKDGYIVKVKDTSSGGEETVDYVVGPRGKMEVGRDGVAQLIRVMFGGSEDVEELEKRIDRTLQVAGAQSDAAPTVEAAMDASQAGGRKRGRPRNEGDEY
jgi:DNA-binding PadR family transcriptional regulator